VTNSFNEFDPDGVKVLVHAYTSSVEAAGLPEHPVGNRPGTRQWAIASNIMEVAILGERHPERLLAAGMRAAAASASPGPLVQVTDEGRQRASTVSVLAAAGMRWLHGSSRPPLPFGR
jgi:hypothetical protein